MGLLGMREIDLLVRGETSALTPVDGTLEAWRLNLEREHPDPAASSERSRGRCS